MNRKFTVPFLLALTLFASTSVHAEGNGQYIIFGDSLSDPGNYFAQFRELEIQPYESNPTGSSFIPSAPYSIGGGHFTNGKTWIEQLTKMLGDPTSGMPATLAPGTFTNYAVGRSRARANPVGVFDGVNLTSQVESFLGDFEGQAPSDATYVIWIGANDVADALLSGNGIFITEALANIFMQVQELYLHGARNFLMVNMPNLAHTPRIQEIAGTTSPMREIVLGGAEAASIGYNLGQYTLVQIIQDSFPGIQATLFDVFTILEDVVMHPTAYGLEIVDEACVRSDIKGKSFCSRPASYLFWDGQHPTKTVHQVIADEARSLLLQ